MPSPSSATVCSAREQAVAAEASARKAADTAEANARAAADTALGQQINALAGELTEKTSLHTIKTLTVSENTLSVQLNLSDVDWSQWKTVHILMDLKGNGYCFPSFATSRLNNVSIGIPGPRFVTFFPMKQADACIAGLFYGYNSPSLAGSGIKYSAFTSFSLSTDNTNYNIAKGTTLTLLGEK